LCHSSGSGKKNVENRKGLSGILIPELSPPPPSWYFLQLYQTQTHTNSTTLSTVIIRLHSPVTFIYSALAAESHLDCVPLTQFYYRFRALTFPCIGFRADYCHVLTAVCSKVVSNLRHLSQNWGGKT
jgi:hypothetical protein